MNIRMTSKGKRPLRSLTPSDKIHAIQRIHDGESKASVARDIGVPESTLRGWCKNEDKLRFMSRQSASDKMAADSLTDKLVDGAAAVLLGGGPPEKRPKMESSMPLNFSTKMKYDEMTYKRSPLNGLDFSTNKALSDLSFNSLGADYSAFKNAEMSSLNGHKNKGYGADLTMKQDPSLAAISPLSSLSHLSGLTGLSHSPLAISFNELTSNLNLIAQLNPSLAAMSGLNGLNANLNTLRNVKPKAQPQQSPRSENDRPQGITVKNWANKKSTNENNSYGMNLSSDNKTKMNSPSPSLAPPMVSQPGLDDPLFYWLKSQQAMLGLNSLYPTPNMSATSPPIRSSTPQPLHSTSTPPISSTPQTPSLTSSGSSEDTKNSAWFHWCKAFGASFNSLNLPNHNQMHQGAANLDGSLKSSQFENILYSHLTKETGGSNASAIVDADNLNNNDIMHTTKAEDLSAKSTIMKTLSPRESPVIRSEADTVSMSNKDVLDNLLYKINHTNNGSDSDASYNSDSLNNNNNNNNNNNSKTDEEEKGRYDASSESEDADGLLEALEHGEKFLKWLESCSNPRVTAMQLMQLRFLIASIKSGTEKGAKSSDDEGQRTKIRRRK